MQGSYFVCTKVCTGDCTCSVCRNSTVYLFRQSSLSEQMNQNSSDWIKRKEKVNRQFEIAVNFKRFCYSLSFFHCQSATHIRSCIPNCTSSKGEVFHMWYHFPDYNSIQHVRSVYTNCTRTSRLC